MSAVRDIVAPDLDVLFVGYNPGTKSGSSGHHFAGPGNLFWALLADSGLTGHRLRPEQDREILAWRLGITNIVDRVTPGSQDLNGDELTEGAHRLHRKIHRLAPKLVTFLGKDIYRAYAQSPKSSVMAWGLQHNSDSGVLYYVAPNPSRRSTLPYDLRLRYFREVKNLVIWGTEPILEGYPRQFEKSIATVRKYDTLWTGAE